MAISHHELTEIKRLCAFFRAQWEAASKRNDVLKKLIEKLEGQLRDLKHFHFGKKSETGSKKTESKPDETEAEQHIKRSRGQQLGSNGHVRTGDLRVGGVNILLPNFPDTSTLTLFVRE